MRERGIDLSGRRSKRLSEFADQRCDYMISLCDRVREGSTDEETYPAPHQPRR